MAEADTIDEELIRRVEDALDAAVKERGGLSWKIVCKVRGKDGRVRERRTNLRFLLYGRWKQFGPWE